MIRPKGIIAAMSTPFFADETLNEAEVRKQVDRLISAGLHGIFALGTNGENYAMDFAEKVQIMGFGTFETKTRAAREGRNPRTGKTIKIAASKYPAFSAGKAFKDSVNK